MVIPAIPSWERIHPLIVHFPIALLLFAPVLALAAAFMKKARMGLLVAAFIMIAAGTIAAYLAVSSGKAAEEVVQLRGEARDVFKEHEALGIETSNIFKIVTVIFALTLGLAYAGDGKWKKSAVAAAGVATCVLYVWGALALANTGHHGAMLVHDFGVHNPISPGVVIEPHKHGPADENDADADHDDEEAAHHNESAASDDHHTNSEDADSDDSESADTDAAVDESEHTDDHGEHGEGEHQH